MNPTKDSGHWVVSLIRGVLWSLVPDIWQFNGILVSSITVYFLGDYVVSVLKTVHEAGPVSRGTQSFVSP